MRKIALLSALYVVQGLPFGFQATALPIYLRERGVSLTAVALSGALAAPWLFKALWAPLVDRFGSARFGRRKSWIVPMQLGLALTALAASFVPPKEALGTLLGLIFLMNLFAATQDIAVDGLAVELLRDEELGVGNAAQVVGYKLGMLTGGGLLVAASRWIGWSGLFAAVALLCAGVLAATLAYRERPPPVTPTERQRLGDIVRTALHALRVPGAGWLLLFIATYKLGESMSDTMFKPFLVDAKFPAWRIGLWLGTYGAALSIAGSLAGGLLARRLELWKAVGLTAGLRVLPLMGRWLLAQSAAPTSGQVISVTLAEEFFGGALTTAMFAFMMSRVDRRVGATHFTLLASVEVLGKSPGAWASGPLAEWLGYPGLFGLAALLSLVFLGLLPLARPPAAPQS